MNFFQLPIGAGPNDPVVGEVDGAQIRRAPNGTKYYSQYRAPAAPAAPSMMTETTLDEQGRAIHNRVPNTTRDQVRSILAGPAAIAGEAVRGLTAPGRALRGEPVTYGDAWATALDYGVGSAPTSAPEGALRSGGIKAYHGSPHDFDKFSMDKIGTGEGAQAYGHGLYFAESEDVARSYRDALSTGRRGSDAPKFRSIGGELKTVSPDDAHDIAEGGMAALDKRIAEVERVVNDAGTYDEHVRFFGQEQADEALGYWKRELEELRGLKDTGDLSLVDGHMYEVNINANPDDFLDWDAPLSEQTNVAARLGFSPEDIAAYRKAQSQDADSLLAALTGDSPYEEVKADPRLRDLGRTGAEYIGGNKLWADKVSPSQRAAEAGIPGIKYKDGMSRGAEGGTRNFVVFDEDLISIVRKYGIAGAAAYLGMPEDEIRQQVGGS